MKAHFGTLSDRMQHFRNEVLNELPYIDSQRAMLVTEVYKNNRHQPPVMKRALMLKHILENMKIIITINMIRKVLVRSFMT